MAPHGTDNDRRQFLKRAAGAGLAAASGMDAAQNVDVLSLPSFGCPAKITDRGCHRYPRPAPSGVSGVDLTCLLDRFTFNHYDWFCIK
ncbi:twin-arginine translocation signal domain-containing protein [Ralstonia solanacearum]|uniref:twin-arginine translocation signal domain-containing protein n=1 Tax=Ralstonia solanacearum TaxID=305 RepID=UPI001E5403DC|nr:twin-arginine translocation signal domain-containing protein [Ralstonia solanacearum]